MIFTCNIHHAKGAKDAKDAKDAETGRWVCDFYKVFNPTSEYEDIITIRVIIKAHAKGIHVCIVKNAFEYTIPKIPPV
jgi:hypothetical protein